MSRKGILWVGMPGLGITGDRARIGASCCRLVMGQKTGSGGSHIQGPETQESLMRLEIGATLETTEPASKPRPASTRAFSHPCKRKPSQPTKEHPPSTAHPPIAPHITTQPSSKPARKLSASPNTVLTSPKPVAITSGAPKWSSSASSSKDSKISTGSTKKSSGSWTP